MRGELSAIGKLVLRGTRIVIPKQLRCQVLELAHEGHRGIVVMKQRLRTKVRWPGIDKEVERACKTCHGCHLVSQPTKPEPMTRTELPTTPWQHLAADLLGCLLVIMSLYWWTITADSLKWNLPSLLLLRRLYQCCPRFRQSWPSFVLKNRQWSTVYQ